MDEAQPEHQTDPREIDPGNERFDFFLLLFDLFLQGFDARSYIRDLHGEDLRVAVAFGEVDRDGGGRAAPLLREHLQPLVVPRDLGAVRLVGHVDAVIDHRAVGVGEMRGRGGGRGGDDGGGVGAVGRGHVGDFGRAGGDEEDREDREGERGREGFVPLDNKQSLETIGRTIAKYASFNADITLEIENRVLARVQKELNADRQFARNGG